MRERAQLEEVVGPLEQLLPEGDLLAQALRLAQDLLRAALVRPEIRRGGLLFELAQALLLCG